MIDAAIFDMDGLLIDSEPLWTMAEIEVFGTVGIELDEDKCRQTVGLGLEEVVEFRYGQQPWTGKSHERVAGEIHVRVDELIRERGRALPGAVEAVAFVREKGARVGLATASDQGLIDAVLDKLQLRGAFDHVQSAAELPRSKPHPDVYLVAAERLGAPPERCLALEDSIPGLIAAKAATMRAIAVPDPALADDPRYSIADVVLGSLRDLDDRVWRRLA